MASIISAGTTSGTALNMAGDTSGVLQLATNGSTTALTISTAQNVGIGTASPAVPLDVVSLSANGYGISLRGRSSDNASTLNLYNNAGTTRYGFVYADTGGPIFGSVGALPAMVYTNGTERMRIDSSGNLLVGQTSGSYNIISKSRSSDVGEVILSIERQQTGVAALLCYAVSQTNYNAANAANKMGRDTTTLRSLNAGGTINASGADYAEYMTKADDFVLAKGDVVGIDTNGKLTNVYADAVSFVVKSTDPSYVGGDTWGSGLEDNSEALEAARQLVDRIAFAGQVPVNVLGATAGQYIIPVNDNGAIKGEAVSSPNFEQYQIAVGKVIAIEADGRARIIVKVA
jgi:hypothetical protein